MANRKTKRARLIAICLFISVLSTYDTFGQYVSGYTPKDTTYKTKHLPHKATFYSALIPGLGQIYNQKYWKVPVIYAGFAALAYYAGYNNYVYKRYKEGYNTKLFIENGDSTLTDLFKFASKENLLRQRDNWRRNRDLCIIGIGLLYVAQIIDANVDAHLFDYDISQDLSMRIDPFYIDPRMLTTHQSDASFFGIKCTFRFK